MGGGIGRLRERRFVDQSVEQDGMARQLLRQRRRMGEDQRDDFGQSRARLQQPEQVHAARQSLDDVGEAVERVGRVGAFRNRLQQTRKHRFERGLRGGRAQRPRLARAPVGDVPRGACGVCETEALELAKKDVGIVGQALALIGREAVEQGADRLDVRRHQRQQFRSIGKAVKRGDIVHRGGIDRQQMGLGIVDHLHAMLDCAQQAIGHRQLLRSRVVQMAGFARAQQ